MAGPYIINFVRTPPLICDAIRFSRLLAESAICWSFDLIGNMVVNPKLTIIFRSICRYEVRLPNR
jgi:hypothetical protein